MRWFLSSRVCGQPNHKSQIANRKCSRLLLSAFCLLFTGSCTVGPKYARPPVETPPAYKELATSAGGAQGEWKLSQPQEQSLRGKWWEIFDDPQLNALEERIEVSNQNLKVAEAQYRQARDLIALIAPGCFRGSTSALPRQ